MKLQGRNIILQFFIFILWFLFIYGPTLDTSLGLFGDVSFFITLFLSFIFMLTGHSKMIWIMISIFFGIFFFALLNTLVLDLSHIEIGVRALMRPLRACGVFMASAVLVEQAFNKRPLHYSNKQWGERLVTILYFAIVFHAMIMVVQFFVPSFKEWIYSFTFAKYQFEHYQMFRMAGLAGAGGAQVSFVQSLGFILGLYLLIIKQRAVTIYLGNVVIIFSIFFSGRSGFLVVFISTLLYLTMCFFKIIKTGKLKWSNANTFYFIGGLVALLLILPEMLKEYDYLKITFERTFRTFIDFYDTGLVKDDTLIAMSKMFYLPEEVGHFLIGKTSYIENNTYYDVFTDIGYFRLIWAYGVVGLMLHITFYMLMLKIIIGLRKSNKILAYCTAFIIFMVLFFNVKEIFIFTKMSFQITLLIFFILYYSNSINHRDNCILLKNK